MSIPFITAEEAAAIIKNGDTVATSGFTASGTPKVVTVALAERARALHEKGEPFKINLFTGASTNDHVDGELARANAIAKRTPYQSHKDCRSLVNIDTDCHRISYYSGKEVTDTPIPAETCGTLLWNAGAVAGIVAALYACDIKPDDLDTPPEELRCKVITGAAKSAQQAAATIAVEWQKSH